MKQTKVYLREEKKYVDVNITDDQKPIIRGDIIKKWQSIINIIAEIINVQAGLIMRITESHMEVFCASETEGNPYPHDGKDSLGHGLYCETVIGKDSGLEIENALEDEKWKDNPDVSLNMISYLGFPIKWPNNEVFGTICVLDNKEHQFSSKYRELLIELKKAIELDLELLIYEDKLLYLSEMDMLTEIYNRRKTESLIKNEFARVKRNHMLFSVVLFDLNSFKTINDTYGHDKGDMVLNAFAKAVQERIRSTDIIGRWGGDEFVMLCPDTKSEDVRKLIEQIKIDACPKVKKIAKEVSVSYGVSTYEEADTHYNQVIKRADIDMYQMKNMKK